MTPIEVRGKYNKAVVYAVSLDSAVIGQLTTLLNQDSISGSTIRIMPDTHAGAGCVIGTTMTITDKVIPNLVGVDIGCGMHLAKLKEQRIELPKLDSVIRKKIPSGFNIRESNHKYCNNTSIEKLKCSASIYYDRAYKSLGTLGGGNHFIEMNKDDEGNVYLVVHTGSRYLGKQVADYYQDKAWKNLQRGNRDKLVKETISRLTAEGRQLEINKAIQHIKDTTVSVPRELAYCDSELFDDYIHDMKLVQEYAHWNRKAIVDTICKEMKLHIDYELETIHNYIDTENMILRKGAVSANLGEHLLIPINMRDGSLMCVGKGNKEWNCSAPHGAGRLMSRSEARSTLSMQKYREDMKKAGIYSTSICRETIDECADAYKPMEDILECITETVEVEKIIKPIYNYKESTAE